MVGFIAQLSDDSTTRELYIKGIVVSHLSNVMMTFMPSELHVLWGGAAMLAVMRVLVFGLCTDILQ